MDTSKNMIRLYDCVIDCLPEDSILDAAQLSLYGLNWSHIDILVRDKLLIKIKYGKYKFLSVNRLYCYGLKLLKNKEFDKAKRCFMKCYQIDNNHLDASLQLLLFSIFSKDYEQAMVYFDKINQSKDKYYLDNNKYILFLLSMLTKLPDKYANQVYNYKLEDLVDSDNSMYDKKVKELSYNQDFDGALNKFKERKKDKLEVKDIIIKNLLMQVTRLQKENKKFILLLLKNGKYEDIIKFLEDIKKQHKLSKEFEFLLILSKDLYSIDRTRTYPQKSGNSNTIYEAILNKDYELAFSMCLKYLDDDDLRDSFDTLYILLDEIVCKINEIKNDEMYGPLKTMGYLNERGFNLSRGNGY